MWHGQFNYSVCLKKSAVIILPIIIQECCIQFLFLFSLPATEWISDFLTICKKKKNVRDIIHMLFSCMYMWKLLTCSCSAKEIYVHLHYSLHDLIWSKST